MHVGEVSKRRKEDVDTKNCSSTERAKKIKRMVMDGFPLLFFLGRPILFQLVWLGTAQVLDLQVVRIL